MALRLIEMPGPLTVDELLALAPEAHTYDLVGGQELRRQLRAAGIPHKRHARDRSAGRAVNREPLKLLTDRRDRLRRDLRVLETLIAKHQTTRRLKP